MYAILLNDTILLTWMQWFKFKSNTDDNVSHHQNDFIISTTLLQSCCMVSELLYWKCFVCIVSWSTQFMLFLFCCGYVLIGFTHVHHDSILASWEPYIHHSSSDATLKNMSEVITCYNLTTTTQSTTKLAYFLWDVDLYMWSISTIYLYILINDVKNWFFCNLSYELLAEIIES